MSKKIKSEVTALNNDINKKKPAQDTSTQKKKNTKDTIKQRPKLVNKYLKYFFVCVLNILIGAIASYLVYLYGPSLEHDFTSHYFRYNEPYLAGNYVGVVDGSAKVIPTLVIEISAKNRSDIAYIKVHNIYQLYKVNSYSNNNEILSSLRDRQNYSYDRDRYILTLNAIPSIPGGTDILIILKGLMGSSEMVQIGKKDGSIVVPDLAEVVKGLPLLIMRNIIMVIIIVGLIVAGLIISIYAQTENK